MRGTGVSVLEFQTPLGRAVSEAINPRPNDRGRPIRQLTYLCYVIVLLFSSLEYKPLPYLCLRIVPVASIPGAFCQPESARN